MRLGTIRVARRIIRYPINCIAVMIPFMHLPQKPAIRDPIVFKSMVHDSFLHAVESFNSVSSDTGILARESTGLLCLISSFVLKMILFSVSTLCWALHFRCFLLFRKDHFRFVYRYFLIQELLIKFTYLFYIFSVGNLLSFVKPENLRRHCPNLQQ